MTTSRLITCTAALMLLAYDGGAADGEVPYSLQRKRKRYEAIWKGTSNDMKANRKRAAQLRKRAESLRPRIKSSDKAKARYEEYLAVAQLFEELAELDEVINAAFSSLEVNRLKFKLAMKKIPRLEDEIKRISGKEVPRDWLTPAEVKELFRRGWVHDTGDPEVLPHARKHWSEPDDDETTNRSAAGRGRP